MQQSEVPTPTPEFMWCQRSDRVYVTIKVSDCKDAMVNVTADNELEFRGHGHGARGVTDYALRLSLSAGVKAELSKWFVCGPSVRVRLEKAKPGPYWNGLTPTKLVQCKVDWQSWIDEDEESEVSAAPNGFDVEDMQMMMVGESVEFYRDQEKFSSSEEEGEEESTVMLDQGLNPLADLKWKFDALDLEREIRSRSQQNRREMRMKTRAAQKLEARRQRNIGYGRPVEPLTAEEASLLKGARTLRQRLKAQKRAEQAYWRLREHHQVRPKQEDMAKAREAAKEAAEQMLRHVTEQLGMDVSHPELRTRARKLLREAALEAALGVVGHKDAAPVAAHEVAAAAAREAVGDPPPLPSAAAAQAAARAAAAAAGMAFDGVSETPDAMAAVAASVQARAQAAQEAKVKAGGDGSTTELDEKVGDAVSDDSKHSGCGQSTSGIESNKYRLHGSVPDSLGRGACEPESDEDGCALEENEACASSSTAIEGAVDVPSDEDSDDNCLLQVNEEGLCEHLEGDAEDAGDELVLEDNTADPDGNVAKLLASDSTRGLVGHAGAACKEVLV